MARGRDPEDKLQEERARRVLDLLAKSKYNEGIYAKSFRATNDNTLVIYIMTERDAITKRDVDIKDTGICKFLDNSLDKVSIRRSGVEEREKMGGMITNLQNLCYTIELSVDDIKKLDPGVPMEEVKEETKIDVSKVAKAKSAEPKPSKPVDATKDWVARKSAARSEPTLTVPSKAGLHRRSAELDPGDKRSSSESTGEEKKKDGKTPTASS